MARSHCVPVGRANNEEVIGFFPAADSSGQLWLGHLDEEPAAPNGPHRLTITWSEAEAERAQLVELGGVELGGVELGGVELGGMELGGMALRR